MKPYAIIFALLLSLLGVLLVILWQPVPEAVSGVAHPEFPTMSQGGEAVRHEGLLGLGWLFGALQIGLFVACLWVSLSGTKLQACW